MSQPRRSSRSRGRPWRGLVAALALTVVASAAATTTAPAPPSGLGSAVYLDPAYSPEERAADLVSRMTLAEKASQMISSQAPAISRLGVRAYGWWNEAIHGVAREQIVDGVNPPELVNTTSYPVSLSLGSTWNPDLIYRVASAISDEAREVVRGNVLDLNFYSPTVNLARDPRWGRNDETYSEDPYLTAAIAAQYVNGMEGKDQQGRLLPESGGYLKTTTTLKHYAANNSEFNRRTGSSDMDERTLREYYTAQFREVIRRSDPASIMTGYNRVNGVPASASLHLLRTLGRQTFGFDGFYTSDCDSIFEIERGHGWRPPGRDAPVDSVERHAFANSAGVDLNCQLGYHDEFNYARSLPEAVGRRVVTELGSYTEHALDTSLVRLFTARIRLGEFDDEDRVPWVGAARSRVSAQSWVNSDLNRAITQTPQRLALAREAAAESVVLLKNKRDGGDRPLLPLAVPVDGAFRIAVVGPAARPPSLYLGGYSSIQGSAGRANEVNGYDGLRSAVLAINPSATVDYLPGIPAVGAGEIDPAAVAAAETYDVVVVYAATDHSTAAEDVDRDDLALPGAQAALISQIAARNPNTVVYLETAGQVDITGFEAGVGALLWSSYNGQRKGEALADVLLGAVGPSGHLPFTWYRDAAQLPPLGDYAIRPSGASLGRTYLYFAGDISFPFGHGLSYTTFGYSDLRLAAGSLDAVRLEANEPVVASVDVTNTGPVTGAEVVQLYVTTPGAPAELERPTKRLVGFAKVNLNPGESARVEFPVDLGALAFFDERDGRYEVDAGEYGFQASASSAETDVLRSRGVTVTGALVASLSTVTAEPRADGDALPGITSRVVYPVGSLVEPQLTVAMTDDTLYGHLRPAAGRPLPPGMTVGYRSSRPEVVRVDESGAIRTTGGGVATVTATVTYRGVTVATNFVVRVLATAR